MLMIYLDNEKSICNSYMIAEILDILYCYVGNTDIFVASFEAMIYDPDDYNVDYESIVFHEAYQLSQEVHAKYRVTKSYAELFSIIESVRTVDFAQFTFPAYNISMEIIELDMIKLTNLTDEMIDDFLHSPVLSPFVVVE